CAGAVPVLVSTTDRRVSTPARTWASMSAGSIDNCPAGRSKPTAVTALGCTSTSTPCSLYSSATAVNRCSPTGENVQKKPSPRSGSSGVVATRTTASEPSRVTEAPPTAVPVLASCTCPTTRPPSTGSQLRVPTKTSSTCQKRSVCWASLRWKRTRTSGSPAACGIGTTCSLGPRTSSGWSTTVSQLLPP